jgi:acetyltransferase-like isoleucine patch superfamily enzyme
MIEKELRYLLKKILFYFNNTRYFYLMNFLKIISGKTDVGKNVSFNQVTRITGIGKVNVGNNVTIGFKPGGHFHGSGNEIQARLQNSKITIGNNVSTNNNLLIISCGEIEIGQDCLIGQNVTLMDFEAHGISPQERNKIGEIGKIKIEDNVWIGNNVLVLKNVKIGKNTVVAAGSVVTKSIPENTIAGGIPCRVIKPI